MRLRPTGKSGSLVLPLCEFRRYFTAGGDSPDHPEGGAQLWERQALTRRRVLLGDSDFAGEVHAAVVQAAYGLAWQPGAVEEIALMRERLEASRPAPRPQAWAGRTGGRGVSGAAVADGARPNVPLIADNEYLASWRESAQAGLLQDEEYTGLKEGYDFLLRVQSRLHRPQPHAGCGARGGGGGGEVARRLGFESGEKFLSELETHRGRIRELYLRLMGRG